MKNYYPYLMQQTWLMSSTKNRYRPNPMRKALVIAGILALSIKPTASLADHLEPEESEMRSGGILFHTNLRGRNLSGADLSDTNLNATDLSGTDLSGANLSKARLKISNLSGADLSNANLSRANTYAADLSGANLSGANLDSARLDNANFSGADLSNANLNAADLSGANLSGITATNLRSCPRFLPRGWVCENNSLKKWTKPKNWMGM